ncbi:MAG: hypothetical protein JO131_10540, partial [Gammaproteobacteria bacterium]|nr:hypothetical protein [Gammaproteobacteria bacterium]
MSHTNLRKLEKYMPHYYISEETLAIHLQYHQQGILNIERRAYCDICCPVEENPEYPPGFLIFWAWISTSYLAQSYNGYTLYIYRQLEESIQKGESATSQKLLTSINFSALVIPIEELSFYVRRIYTVTDRFQRQPSLNQILEAGNLYRAPQQQQQQQPQQQVNMAITRDEMRDLLKAVFGTHATNNTLPANFSTEMATQFTTLRTANQNRPSGKVIDVPLFYGNDEEDPEEWLQLFEQAHQANGWSNDNSQKIALAAGDFRDAARD